MYKYHIRLTMNDHPKIINFFKDYSCVIGFEKPDDRPHYHVHLECDIKVDTLRRIISKALDLYDKKRSCSKDRGKSNIYAVKEGRIILNTLYNDDELSELIRQSTSKELSKTDNFTTNTIRLYTPLALCDQSYAPVHMKAYVISALKSVEKGISKIIFQRIYFAIMARYYPELFEEASRYWIFEK